MGCFATITARLHNERIMIGWLKQRLVDWAFRMQQKEIDRLHAEAVRLKAEVLKNNGGKPIVLSPEEHQRLNEMRKKIDPEVLKRIDLLADERSLGESLVMLSISETCKHNGVNFLRFLLDGSTDLAHLTRS